MSKHDVNNRSSKAAVVHPKKDQIIPKTVNISQTDDFYMCIIYSKPCHELMLNVYVYFSNRERVHINFYVPSHV